MTLPDDAILARMITLDSPLGWHTRNDVAEVLRDADRRIAEADRRVETVMRRLSFASRLLLPWRRSPLIPKHESAPELASRKAADVAARGYLPDRVSHPRAYPELRIAHLGVSARFASLAPHTPITEEALDTVLSHADLVLVEPGDDDPNMLATFAPTLLAAAAARGVPSVVVFTTAPHDSVWHGATYVLSETSGAETLGLSIDTDTFNPVGYHLKNDDPLTAITHTSVLPDVLHATEFTPQIVTFGAGDAAFPLHRRIGTPHGLRQVLRNTSVLADLAELRHPDPAAAKRLVLAALASGIPVVTTDMTHTGLAEGVIHTDNFADTVHRLVDDTNWREKLSITARRHVLTHASRQQAFERLLDVIGYPRAATPQVTVLLSTNRPEFVDTALARIANQTYAALDVSLVLHGDAFAHVDAPTHPLLRHVTRAPSAWTLGSCLNAAFDQAGGTFVAKMDDDDHYGPNHLTDLLLAHRYAKADIVGKQAEFVYLADRNVTVRRPLGASERRRSHVAGPTPLMRRELLASHRFLPVPRRVDSTLYERVIASGGSVYATHARDFVLERRASGHTWNVDGDTFVDDASETHDGLAIDVASSQVT